MVPIEHLKHAVAGLSLLLLPNACSPHATPAARYVAPSDAQQAANEPAPSAPATAIRTEDSPIFDSGDPEHEADSDPDASAESEPVQSSAGTPLTHPLDGWSEERIEQAVAHDLASLGSMSVGTPNAGALINGVQAVASPLYTLVNPGSAWGTLETIDYLDSAVRAVHEEFPDTPALALGDIGARNGGPLRPHISHQAGRDLDISFYYRAGTHWYVRGTRENLDFPRLWAFVRALIAQTDIDLILLDHGLQEPLKEYALSIGEEPAWIEQVFEGKGALRAIIRHAPGHATHLHLRFWNPIAQETARRCFAALARRRMVRVPEQYLTHKAKKNETLAMIAKKYGTSVSAIRQANGLRSNLIHDQVLYRIPIAPTGSARMPQIERVRIPARRTPPPRRELNRPGPPLSAREQNSWLGPLQKFELHAADSRFRRASW